MIDKDKELQMIGEETKAIFDKLACSPVTNHDRVVKIGRTIMAIESRIEDMGHPHNFITLLMVSECLSLLRDLELGLRPIEQSKDDE